MAFAQGLKKIKSWGLKNSEIEQLSTLQYVAHDVSDLLRQIVTPKVRQRSSGAFWTENVLVWFSVTLTSQSYQTVAR